MKKRILAISLAMIVNLAITGCSNITKNVDNVQNKPYSLTDNFSNAKKQGLVESKDFISGKTIDIIDVDKYGKAIFMTPNTSVEYKYVVDKSNEILQFRYGIHPIAKDWGSDGVGFIIEVSDESGKIETLKENVTVTPQEGLKDFKMDLKKFAGKNVILKISCDNGIADDDVADWGIILGK